MMAPKVLLLVEDEAVSGAIRFALEAEEFEVVVLANFAELQSVAGPGSCVVIDRGASGAEALGFLRNLRERGVDGPAVVLASTPSKRLGAAVAAQRAVLIQKPLLWDELVAAIRGFSCDRGELQ